MTSDGSDPWRYANKLTGLEESSENLYYSSNYPLQDVLEFYRETGLNDIACEVGLNFDSQNFYEDRPNSSDDAQAHQGSQSVSAKASAKPSALGPSNATAVSLASSKPDDFSLGTVTRYKKVAPRLSVKSATTARPSSTLTVVHGNCFVVPSSASFISNVTPTPALLVSPLINNRQWLIPTPPVNTGCHQLLPLNRKSAFVDYRYRRHQPVSMNQVVQVTEIPRVIYIQSTSNSRYNQMNNTVVSTLSAGSFTSLSQPSPNCSSSAAHGIPVAAFRSRSAPVNPQFCQLPVIGRSPSTDSIRPKKFDHGLKQFAMHVYTKVKEKLSTTYREIADELVNEFVTDDLNGSEDVYNDCKNIRRRVYDAMNVLIAANLVGRGENKEIHWNGIPKSFGQKPCSELEDEKNRLQQAIIAKKEELRQALLHVYIGLKNVVERNARQERNCINTSHSPVFASVCVAGSIHGASLSTAGSCSERFVCSASAVTDWKSRLNIPFIVVTTHGDTVIDCSISQDRSEYLFKFSNNFEIHDDAEVLKCLARLLDLESDSNWLEQNEASDDLRTAVHLFQSCSQTFEHKA